MEPNDLEHKILAQKQKSQSVIIGLLTTALIVMIIGAGAYIFFTVSDPEEAPKTTVPMERSEPVAIAPEAEAEAEPEPEPEPEALEAPTPGPVAEPAPEALSVVDPEDEKTEDPPADDNPVPKEDPNASDPDYDARPLGEQAEADYPLPESAPLGNVTSVTLPDADAEALSALMSDAYDAMDAQAFEKADKLAREATKLARTDQDKSDLKILQDSIDLALRQAIAARSEALGDKASAQDQWDRAQNYYEQALEHGTNDALTSKLARAKSILSHQDNADALLKDPYQMAKQGGRDRLARLKNASKIDQTLSPKLKSDIKNLEDIVARLDQPVTVTILSDGQSFISVIGVGRVGEVEEKTISLKPGRYILEAARPGHRNKRMDVTIPFDRPADPITLIADEEI